MPTPNFDQLAREGMFFTNFYGQPSCTPGRAAIQTGRIPNRSGMTTVAFQGQGGGLPAAEWTLGSMLREAGYKTYFTGKWHLGEADYALPNAQGYDVMKHAFLYHLNAYTYPDPEWFPEMSADLRELFRKVTTGSLSGNAGEKATEDWKVNGEYVDTPEKGVVGIPYLDGYVEKAALEFLDDAAKSPDTPFFINVNFMKNHQARSPSAGISGSNGCRTSSRRTASTSAFRPETEAGSYDGAGGGCRSRNGGYALSSRSFDRTAGTPAMIGSFRSGARVAPFAFAATLVSVAVAAADPLPSWNEGDTKSAIIGFVETVTDPKSDSFVPVKARIAVFDNDGTLWAEQPAYFQLLYALDVLREKARADPSILTSDVLKAANEGDMKGMMADGEEGLLEIINVSHGNITVEDFKSSAHEWLTTATHPTTGMTYASMTYQPMLELLTYLRDEDFSTYIVSGGGIDFIRAISDEAYNIPSWQVVGSEGKTSYTDADGVPTLTKEGGISFIDDKAGKPVGIIRHIGQRPIFAAGNSDGDFQMLEWTTAGDGPRFGMLVHHTDAKREFAYDREGHIGVLNKGLDEAGARGWIVVDMAKDWAKVWPGN